MKPVVRDAPVKDISLASQFVFAEHKVSRNMKQSLMIGSRRRNETEIDAKRKDFNARRNCELVFETWFVLKEQTD